MQLPRWCFVCQAELIHSLPIPICPDCRRELPWLHGDNALQVLMIGRPQHGVVRAQLRSVFAYETPIPRLLTSWKKHNNQLVGNWLIRLAVEATVFAATHIVVPVPQHWRTMLWRGHQPTRTLALRLAQHNYCSVHELLQKKRSNPPQKGLTNPQRRINVRGVFKVQQPQQLQQYVARPLLLVDDVMTTGTTIRACLLQCYRAGFCQLSAFTIARVD